LQMKSLHRCLGAETGSLIFSTEMKITQTLGLEYVKPRTGVYNKIPWSYKSTAKVIHLCLVTLFKSPKFRCNHIDITISWGEESQVFTLDHAL
jgi:hypothetical protein